VAVSVLSRPISGSGGSGSGVSSGNAPNGIWPELTLKLLKLLKLLKILKHVIHSMKIKISEVKDLSSPIAHLLPVQSVRQLGSYTACTLVGFFIFQLILMALRLPLATPIVLVAAFMGSSVILSLALPARFFVEVESIDDCLSLRTDIATRIVKYGYQLGDAGNATTSYFKSRLPSILSWEENSITLEVNDKIIIITGPVLMMRMLRGNLKGESLGKI